MLENPQPCVTHSDSGSAIRKRDSIRASERLSPAHQGAHISTQPYALTLAGYSAVPAAIKKTVAARQPTPYSTTVSTDERELPKVAAGQIGFHSFAGSRDTGRCHGRSTVRSFARFWLQTLGRHTCYSPAQKSHTPGFLKCHPSYVGGSSCIAFITPYGKANRQSGKPSQSDFRLTIKTAHSGAGDGDAREEEGKRAADLSTGDK
ncbi:ornithine cyclodeaminase [Anopheles sinensis]|uniref:Ornithine cyclodeaminase n=1 Tax=Anopheles sinensis TaxID=74873 RepID=A0A084VIS6_ANOSI|nr:ornithine cyclodeaminase [Anopheles sinensis]